MKSFYGWIVAKIATRDEIEIHVFWDDKHRKRSISERRTINYLFWTSLHWRQKKNDWKKWTISVRVYLILCFHLIHCKVYRLQHQTHTHTNTVTPSLFASTDKNKIPKKIIIRVNFRYSLQKKKRRKKMHYIMRMISTTWAFESMLHWTI